MAGILISFSWTWLSINRSSLHFDLFDVVLVFDGGRICLRLHRYIDIVFKRSKNEANYFCIGRFTLIQSKLGGNWRNFAGIFIYGSNSII